MKTREQLISYYEKQLEKVISAYGGEHLTDLLKDRGKEYIDQARKDLEAVKNGREW